MKNLEADTFTLENFEGPLDFLLHLIQKNEIDIYEVPIHKLTEQYLKKLEELISVDGGAEFIGITASLLHLKSRMLLPKHEQIVNPEDEEIDPRFEIIHQLLDYCRFKEAAKGLSDLEQRQNNYFGRGSEGPGEIKKPLGIEHLSLQDFANLFQQILIKSTNSIGHIEEDEWRVSDKIRFIRQLIKEAKKIGFELLFSLERSKDELIVTFLAVLELMKLQEIRIMREIALNKVVIVHHAE